MRCRPEADGDKDRYIDLVCREMLPAVAQAGLADAVDAFMEGIAFSGDQTARVFRAAKALGLPVKLHADQLSNLGGAALASEFSALSADHLEHTDEAGVAAMARAGTVAVLLPGAFYFIRETTKPPVELFRAHGVNMALATDCNPGSSPLTSLLLAMNMGATLFRMTVAECLAGVTREGARALGILDETGTLEAGKWCDLAIWDIERPAELDLPDRLQPAAPPGVEGTMSDRRRIHCGFAGKGQPRRSGAGACRRGRRARSIVLAARRGGIGHCCEGRGCATRRFTASIPGSENWRRNAFRPDQTTLLQRNLIVSHCCGVGPPTPEPIVRLMMALKIVSLGRGASGVRREIIEQLQAMLARGICPLVPQQGSVGASGDLAPLAHMTAVMIGEGQALVGGKAVPGRDALAAADLAPIDAGTEGRPCADQRHAVFDGLCHFRVVARPWSALRDAGDRRLVGRCGDGFDGAVSLRRSSNCVGMPDKSPPGAALTALLEGSDIRMSHLEGDERVQDPYCLRCQPQVAGAALDLLTQAARTLTIEANAVTDNPLVLVETGEIVSGGNFHAEPVAFAADQIALALSEIGAISERRIATLVDPALNFGLPPFLTPEPGINSGFMIAEVTAAALYAENKQRAAACSINSTPTSANQEDHVSMAAHAARRLSDMADNLAAILGIELLVAAQGIGLRAPHTTSPALAAVIAVLREQVPALGGDRYMADDLAKGNGAGRSRRIAGRRDVGAREQSVSNTCLSKIAEKGHLS